MRHPRTVAHDRMDRGYASPLPPYPPGGIYIMIVSYNPRVGGDDAHSERYLISEDTAIR
jgi:hypothetical protein